MLTFGRTTAPTRLRARSLTTKRVSVPEVEERLGPRRSLVNPIVGTIFPNFSFLRTTSRSMRVWQPRGPTRSKSGRGLTWTRRPLPDVREAVRLGGVYGFSPSGTFEQDDMDNWQQCTQTAQGLISRGLALNIGMGLGHEATARI